MNKQIFHYRDIHNKIIHAVDTLANPVVSTLGPKGSNVIYEDDKGNQFVTNDGVTIAKNIVVKDQLENSVISVIKHSAMKTNSEAGDGTTTSILLSQNLIKSGLKLVEDGWNPIFLAKEFEKFGKKLVERIKKITKKITNDTELTHIATISANNNDEIAKDVVSVVKVAGTDGMVFIEPNQSKDTEIIEDVGFLIEQGMFSQDLRTEKNRYAAKYQNVPVLITDKRIYYTEEAETILRTVITAGYNSVVIVARDFIGQSGNTFLANHNNGNIKVLLVKDPNVTEKYNETLQDLAAYLGGKVVTEKNGSIVNKLTISDFCFAGQVYSDIIKTLITPQKKSTKDVKSRIDTIKKELEKDKDNKELKKRLSSLTNGMVTIKVGGATPIEIQERMFRYEDAVNATRAAIKHGYLPGGGVALMKAFVPSDYPDELVSVFRKYCETSLRQLAKNCGEHEDTIIRNVQNSKSNFYGYNALTNEYGDMIKFGVIDPYQVTEMAIENSISVANVIISSQFIIVNDIEDDKTSKE